MLNSALGLVFCLVIAGATFFSGNTLLNIILENYAGIENAGDAMPYMVVVLLSTLTSMTYITGPSISVESKNIWILKSMPVKATDVLKGKMLSHLVPTIPVLLVSSILFIIAIPMDVMEMIAVILIPQLTNLFCALIGLLANLFVGRLDYPSEARAVKSTSTALIPMLSTAVLAIGPAVLYFNVFRKQGVTFTTALAVTAAFLLVLDLVLYFLMNSSLVQKRWDQIGK
jgi:ABC-2 type transport system permease protein